MDRFDSVCPSAEVRCKREGLGFVFVDTPSRIVGVLLSKTTPLGNPLPGGSKDKGNVRLISEQTISPSTRLIDPPMASKVGRPNTHWSEISFPRAKEINNGSHLLTR